MHFSYFFKDTEKKRGKASAQDLIKHFPSSWMKNANSGQHKEWEWGQCWLAASPPLLPPISNTWNAFWEVWLPIAGGMSCKVLSSGLRAAGELTEHTNFPSQNPEIISKSWGRNLTMSRRNAEHKNLSWSLEKFQIDLTHNMPQEFAVFLCAAIPHWITRRAGGSLGRS